jgi:hypothetical protein
MDTYHQKVEPDRPWWPANYKLILPSVTREQLKLHLKGGHTISPNSGFSTLCIKIQVSFQLLRQRRGFYTPSAMTLSRPGFTLVSMEDFPVISTSFIPHLPRDEFQVSIPLLVTPPQFIVYFLFFNIVCIMQAQILKYKQEA